MRLNSFWFFRSTKFSQQNDIKNSHNILSTLFLGNTFFLLSLYLKTTTKIHCGPHSLKGHTKTECTFTSFFLFLCVCLVMGIDGLTGQTFQFPAIDCDICCATPEHRIKPAVVSNIMFFKNYKVSFSLKVMLHLQL